MTCNTLALLLLLLVLVGCDDATDMDMDMDLDEPGLSGEFERVGLPDCQGAIPLQDLPVERHFIQANRLLVEQVDEYLSVSTANGNSVARGRLDDIEDRTLVAAYLANDPNPPDLERVDAILGMAYSIAIDAVTPLRYAEITVQRVVYLVDGGDVLEVADHFESYGDTLACSHEFQRW